MAGAAVGSKNRLPFILSYKAEIDHPYVCQVACPAAEVKIPVGTVNAGTLSGLSWFWARNGLGISSQLPATPFTSRGALTSVNNEKFHSQDQII
jgi:hypothetical protein